ncbi:hypothetical protein QVD17_41916 [Tagetes erecta]|uniref:PGG domain-containing protein n=1 Tax=Tagetes erecta TaxID=13708 RepID=A0AAD8JL52_TARER|nr:hypothetical protein QVD17_41916 [Tagetes erecta]
MIRQDSTTVSQWAIAMQLKNLISDHVDRMEKMLAEPKKCYFKASMPTSYEQLHNLISERLLHLHAETKRIIDANKPDFQVLGLQNQILKHIANVHEKSQKIFKNNNIGTEEKVSQLRNIIKVNIEKLKEDNQNTVIELEHARPTYSSRVLFIAAELGNTRFLVELIRLYPDLIWKVNDDNQTIFHIAVKHRHEGIYSLLYEIGAMKDLITPLKDPQLNNMLHLVGKIAKQKRLDDVSGFALQMQKELLWFEEVKNMIPPSYREKVNKDGLTPHELFTKEHKDLLTQGEKWIKGTASQCMVVSALIATIVFGAAFTVPGGYNQTSDDKNGQHNGIPVFHSKAYFWVFVVADAISLSLSCASLLIFLSILTSRYAERDFKEKIPNKLISGLLALFFSIMTMMVAFGVSFFVLYHKGLKWMPITICVFAALPVLLYIWLQYRLFFDVIRSTYLSKRLFKPKKHFLYYENPKA